MRKKITTIICLMLCICVQGVAQQIKASNEALTEVLQQIQQKTGYRFYWMTDEVKGIKVTIDADAKDMQLLLRTLLAQTNLKYTIHGNKNVFLAFIAPMHFLICGILSFMFEFFTNICFTRAQYP